MFSLLMPLQFSASILEKACIDVDVAVGENTNQSKFTGPLNTKYRFLTPVMFETLRDIS